jgi:hypothetical protein
MIRLASNHDTTVYVQKFQRGPREVGTEENWKSRPNVMGIIVITE